MKHTPTPWRISNNELGHGNYDIIAFGNDTFPSIGVASLIDARFADDTIGSVALHKDEIEANAAIIIRAVNSHDDLVRELKAREWFDDGDKFGPHCQTCGNYKRTGHSNGCKLKAVLDLCEVQE